MPEKPVYLTVEGKQEIEEELHYLKTVRRPEVAAAIHAAKEEGDISENSAYDEAKNEQAFVEGRIMTLEAMLRDVVLIEHDGKNDVVYMGSKVTLREAGSDELETYFIVGSVEADPADGKISNESPLGKALLGATVGDRVSALAPGGEIEFEVVKIE